MFCSVTSLSFKWSALTFCVREPRYARLMSPVSSEIMMVRESVTSERPTPALCLVPRFLSMRFSESGR